jgi:predicted transglutaminase-like cysteine proteinase
MKKTNRQGAWACAALAALLVQAAPAAAQTVASLPTSSAPALASGDARPLPAWTEFCRRQPQECATDLDEPTVIPLTQRTWRAIVSINRKVNASYQPLADREHWGLADRWDLLEDGFGDCEDFQLLKRKLLAEAGVPRRAMRMTVVIDEKREGHAVLMVRTDRGDFVLDNKTSAVLPWHQTGYVFVKRESDSDLRWVSLGGATAPVVTANR